MLRKDGQFCEESSWIQTWRCTKTKWGNNEVPAVTSSTCQIAARVYRQVAGRPYEDRILRDQQLFFPGYLLHNESNLPELSVLFRLPPRITFRE